jgi:hypothetical protein
METNRTISREEYERSGGDPNKIPAVREALGKIAEDKAAAADVAGMIVDEIIIDTIPDPDKGGVRHPITLRKPTLRHRAHISALCARFDDVGFQYNVMAWLLSLTSEEVRLACRFAYDASRGKYDYDISGIMDRAMTFSECFLASEMLPAVNHLMGFDRDEEEEEPEKKG